MSITSWDMMALDLVKAPEMANLSDDEVRAIIDLLALTIHADRKVSPVEVAGFNHLFFDLSWLEGRHELVRQHVPKAAEQAAVEGDAVRGRQLAEAAAAVLGSAEVRRIVLLMAASLAAVDSKVTPEENEALRWVADAFEIDEAGRSAIFEKVGR